MCAESARSLRNAEMDKVEASYEKKLDTIEDRLRREERELRQDEADLAQRRMEEYGTHAENVLSLFSKRSRRLSTSLSKRRMTERAEADVEESRDAIEDYRQQIADLEQELKNAITEVQAKWVDIADDIDHRTFAIHSLHHLKFQEVQILVPAYHFRIDLPFQADSRPVKLVFNQLIDGQRLFLALNFFFSKGFKFKIGVNLLKGF